MWKRSKKTYICIMPVLLIIVLLTASGCSEKGTKENAATVQQAEAEPEKPKVNATKVGLATIYFTDKRGDNEVLSSIKSDGTGYQVILNYSVGANLRPAPDGKRIVIRAYSEETKQSVFKIYNTETKEMHVVPDGPGWGLLQGWYDENHIMVHQRGLERRDIHTGKITPIGEFIRPLQLSNKNDFVDMGVNELCFYFNGQKHHCNQLPLPHELASIATITRNKSKIGYLVKDDEKTLLKAAFLVIDTAGQVLHQFTNSQMGHSGVFTGGQMLGPDGEWLYYIDYKNYEPFEVICRLKVTDPTIVQNILVSEKGASPFSSIVVGG